jgi:hypothetical protein
MDILGSGHAHDDDDVANEWQYKTHLYLARGLLPCPSSSDLDNESTRHIVATACFVLQGFAGALFAFFALSRYNSVAVFTHRVRTSTISNMLWIYFFIVASAHGVVDAIRYTLSVEREDASHAYNHLDMALFSFEVFINPSWISTFT